MFSIKKMIGGIECECYEAESNAMNMRLQLEGTFGDVTRESLMLVPLCLPESAIEELSGLWLTEQEKELGLPLGESCSSSSWWCGSSDSSKDMNITDKYDVLILQVLNNEEIRQSLQNEIDSLYEKFDKFQAELEKEYEDGETDWAAQLEVKCEDIENAIADKEELLKNSRLIFDEIKIKHKTSINEQIQGAANQVSETKIGSFKNMDIELGM